MTTGLVWGMTLIIVGFLLSLGALQLLTAAVFPGLVGQASRNLRGESIGKSLALAGASLFIGLVVVVTLMVLGGGAGWVKVLLSPLVVVLVVLLAAGLGAVSLGIGARLPSPDDAGRPWRRLVRGAVTSELAYAVPVVGWFFVLPLSALLGLGATFIALFQRDGRRDAVSELRPEPVA